MLGLATLVGGSEVAADEKSSIREHYEAILEEWDAANKIFEVEYRKVRTDKDRDTAYDRFCPDPVEFSRRFIDLAASEPTDPASLAALTWVLNQCCHTADKRGPFSEQVGRAVDLLVRHHADDLGVARTALSLSRSVSSNFDTLITSLSERSKTRDVKGTMCLALARSHYAKARLVPVILRTAPPWRYPSRETDEKGNRVTGLGEPAYETYLRSLDPASQQREAERLLERVIAEYADVPYAIGEGSQPSRGSALERTLGLMAEELLDEIRHLSAGSLAPEIDSHDLDGNLLRLSDYRGKVVLLVFWGSWCGPCMAEVPHERDLADRYRGRPFALLGVDCEESKDDGRKAMIRSRIGWPNYFDGRPGEGPIAKQYHVAAFPSLFLIDAKGRIRYKQLLGLNLDKAVKELVEEAESSAR